MKILKVDPKNLDMRIIKRAVATLKSGNLIVYPTDTAYGLGGNALNEKAIKKVYEAKSRDYSKPTHVIVRDWKMIEQLTCPNDLTKKLFDKFLPGPLTIILKKGNIVPNILTANLPTLGVRIPKCKVTKMISQEFEFPYTTPSANFEGGTTPYSVEEIKGQLDIAKVDLILDAGELPRVKLSTIVDLTVDPPKILRQGEIASKDIMLEIYKE